MKENLNKILLRRRSSVYVEPDVLKISGESKEGPDKGLLIFVLNTKNNKTLYLFCILWVFPSDILKTSKKFY